MKDRIFIAWSNLNLAKTVGKYLEKNDYGYCVGGNENNDAGTINIGDAVLDQIKKCNQAIVIFQNKTIKTADGSEKKVVSGNLFFEFGYAIAAYGADKVHCVKRNCPDPKDDIVMPTDLETGFIKGLDGDDDEAFAEAIVGYFLERQKMTVTTNKMELINNRHLMRELIESHYSKHGSKCSDYELAQYVLFYSQAEHMFQDEPTAVGVLNAFKSDNLTSFSEELRLAVDFSIGFSTLMTKLLKREDSDDIYVLYDDFREFSQVCAQVEEQESDDVDKDIGDFYAWYYTFVYETWNFAYMLVGENPDEDALDRAHFLLKATEKAEKAFKMMDYLENNTVCGRNNDAIGILALFRSYLDRNQFITMRDLGALTGRAEYGEQSKRYLMDACQIREQMLTQYRGALDSKLYETINMEYYLISCECIKYAGDMIDNRQKRAILDNVEKFLSGVKSSKAYVYIEQIKTLYEKLMQAENE